MLSDAKLVLSLTCLHTSTPCNETKLTKSSPRAEKTCQFVSTIDMSPHERRIQDGLGFWIPVFVSGTWILDSLSCIPDVPGFQIPQAKIFRIAESGFPYIGRDMEPARSAQRDSGR